MRNTKKVQDWISIYLTPGPTELQAIRAEYEKVTKTTDKWEHHDIWTNLFKQHTETIEYVNMTMEEAEVLAEPLRIAYPDRHVNIAAADTSYIGNVTWEDQMKMFFEYPTFTELGAKLAKERQEEAKRLGIKASWE